MNSTTGLNLRIISSREVTSVRPSPPTLLCQPHFSSRLKKLRKEARTEKGRKRRGSGNFLVLIIVVFRSITTFFQRKPCFNKDRKKLFVKKRREKKRKEMEIVETSKGKPLVLYKGYQFRQYRCNGEVITWLCLNEKTSRCKGRMATRNGEILKFIEHTCKPDLAKCEVKKHVAIARKRAKEEVLPIAQIYKEEVGQLVNRGYEFITNVPTYSSVKSSLYRLRRGKRDEDESNDSKRIVLTKE